MIVVEPEIKKQPDECLPRLSGKTMIHLFANQEFLAAFTTDRQPPRSQDGPEDS